MMARPRFTIDSRFLPFADAPTADLPLHRLLRLSLFQVSNRISQVPFTFSQPTRYLPLSSKVVPSAPGMVLLSPSLPGSLFPAPELALALGLAVMA